MCLFAKMSLSVGQCLQRDARVRGKENRTPQLRKSCAGLADVLYLVEQTRPKLRFLGLYFLAKPYSERYFSSKGNIQKNIQDRLTATK